MKTRTWMWLTGGVVALLALALLVQVAGAQTPPNQATPGQGYGMGSGNRPGPMHGPGAGYQGGGPRAGMMGGAENSLLAVVAEQVQMTREDLVAELQTGKTMAEVAAEHNVAVATIVDAFLAPRAERLAERVAAGQITQAQADEMLATMRAHVTDQLDQPWTPRGPGQGAGFVDENGDGVCAHAASAGQMRGMMGRGRR
jgi:hypothetical protein